MSELTIEKKAAAERKFIHRLIVILTMEQDTTISRMA